MILEYNNDISLKHTHILFCICEDLLEVYFSAPSCGLNHPNSNLILVRTSQNVLSSLKCPYFTGENCNLLFTSYHVKAHTGRRTHTYTHSIRCLVQSTHLDCTILYLEIRIKVSWSGRQGFQLKSRVRSHQIECCHRIKEDTNIRATLLAGWLQWSVCSRAWRKRNAFQEGKLWHEMKRSGVDGYAVLSHHWRSTEAEVTVIPWQTSCNVQ